MIIIILGVILSVAFITLLERKLMGNIQRRTGPTKVGLLGLFQPILDGIKLILKESILPSTANIFLFLLAPFIVFYLSLLNWLFIPLTNTLVISETPAGILVLIALAELGIFGVLYAGWAANSKYPLIGSLRSTAQMISYSLTLSLILLALVFVCGDINLLSFLLFSKWKILLPLFPIFLISALAETNRAPFDLPEAESELVAGFFTEHSAIGFVYFFLGEYTSILTISTLGSILFFASSLSFSFTFLIFILWIRAVLPRFRFDMLLKLGWTVLLPFTLVYCVILIPSFLITFD
jgi:NADH-ubiquinone oxidoreductase chain 1